MGSSCSLPRLCCLDDSTAAPQHASAETVYEACPSLNGPARSDIPPSFRGGSERSSLNGGGNRVLSPIAPTLMTSMVAQEGCLRQQWSKPNLRVDLSETTTMVHSPVAHPNDGAAGGGGGDRSSRSSGSTVELQQHNLPVRSSSPPVLKLVYPQRHNPLTVSAVGNNNGGGGGAGSSAGVMSSFHLPQPPPVPPSTTPTRSVTSRYSYHSAKPPLSRQMSSLQSMPNDDRVTSSSVTTIHGQMFEWGGALYGGGGADDTASIAHSQSQRATIFLPPPTPSEDGRRSLVAFHVPRNSTPLTAVGPTLPPVLFSTADADDIASHPHHTDSGVWGIPNRSTTDSLQSVHRRSTAASSQWGGSYAAGSFDHNSNNNNAFSLPTFRPA
ncbi:Hypothetical protein, putative [Bodo saltans]|uniref:Uncharacterized protein n=1 Tax=Bodo saltans TaxID=75058 RepID=A0A0S4JLY3_BODSA|nr:Hypothetical protein, putative [Bodo saltans]|eukprot:CUG91138.1 Hypothetical protein, putative [Bodo saltans]